MPIVKNAESVHVEYTIPKDIKSRIPDYFYYAMAGELVSIFGPHILEKVDYPEYDNDGNEIPGDPNIDNSYYDLCSGTGGWYAAFEMTCKKLNMMWLNEYCNTLPWYDGDVFDGEIEYEIIERFCKKDHVEDHSNCYYEYMISLEEINNDR